MKSYYITYYSYKKDLAQYCSTKAEACTYLANNVSKLWREVHTDGQYGDFFAERADTELENLRTVFTACAKGERDINQELAILDCEALSVNVVTADSKNILYNDLVSDVRRGVTKVVKDIAKELTDDEI